MPAADYARLRVVRKDSTVAGDPAMSGGSNPPTTPNGNASPPLSTTDASTGSTSGSTTAAGGGGGGSGILVPVMIGRSGLESLMGGKPKHTVHMEPKGKTRRRRKPRLGVTADDIATRTAKPVALPAMRTKATTPMLAPPTTAPAPALGFDAAGQPAAEDTELAIGFRLPADTALALALRNGIPPQTLFLEICEIGEGGEWDAETAARVQAVMQLVAADEPPMMAMVSGIGRMMANEETGGRDLIYATVDSPDLDEFREDVMDALEEAGVLPLEEHSFIPMIPLAYVEPNAPAPMLANIARATFPLAAVSVQLGAAFVDYALTGEEEAFDADNPAGLAGDAAGLADITARLPLVSNKSADATGTDVRKAVWCPIVKTDSERRLVSGIVLQPEVVDAQGDIVGEAVIEAAAHQFLADYNAGTTLGHMHKNFDRKLELVESYIAPVDLPINGAVVKKGTWLITSRVVDDATWDQVKNGEIKGFSIGGVAKARPLTD
jgi:hypothetical protein